jgi:hypothetical protein
VNVADWEELPRKPVIVTAVLAETEDVLTVKFANPWPAGTLTIAGG